jgi:hypothetical protein
MIKHAGRDYAFIALLYLEAVLYIVAIQHLWKTDPVSCRWLELHPAPGKAPLPWPFAGTFLIWAIG